MRKLIPHCNHALTQTDTTMVWQVANFEYDKGFYFCHICGYEFERSNEHETEV